MMDQHIIISADALVQEIGGEAVILDLASSTYFGLDDISLRIWNLLDTCTNMQEVLHAMVSEYDVSATQMEADLTVFVEQLLNAGLVRVQSV